MMLYIDWEKQFSIKKNFIHGSFFFILFLFLFLFFLILNLTFIFSFLGVFPVSGVFDLTPIKVAPSVNTNGCLQIDDQDVQRLSPLILSWKNERKVFCEIFLSVGEDDSEEFQRQMFEYLSILKEENQNLNQTCSITAEIVKERDHFNIIEDLRFSDFSLTKKILNLCLL